MTEQEVKARTERLEQLDADQEQNLLEQYIGCLVVCAKEDSEHLPLCIYMECDERGLWLNGETGEPDGTRLLVTQIVQHTDLDSTKGYEELCDSLMEHQLNLPFMPENYGYQFHTLEQVIFG